ncbi:MAG: addiction module protein [Sedimentisphaerales bacterium]|nr:addiction module protein [Sedimentisphaerales bacterium]
MTTKEIIEEVASLPADERALVADSILRSLNTSDPDVDAQWTQVARRRLAELRTGAVQPVPGEQVFAKVWKRFEQ